MRKKILAAAMVSAMTLSGPAHAGWFSDAWDDVTDWVDGAASDTVSWLGGAASDSVSWVSGAWEDSVDWTEGAWNTVEDFYGDVRDAAGTAISYGESGIQTVSLIVGNAVQATVNNYDYGLNTNDWRIKALRLQNKIDNQELLGNALFVGTHNSYNAKEYSTAFSYLDPNHKMSLYDQLDAGMVALEIDVHKFTKANSFWVWEWDSELMLCHGQSNHTGCSTYDRSFIEGLAEIELWLKGNSEDVIFIYIEDHMDGDYDHAISFIEETIGDYVYRPTGNSGCEGMPMDVSKQDILNSGKQVILWGAGDVCSASSEWQSIAFGGSGWNGANVEEARVGICETSSDDQWLRYFEDRTGMSYIWGASDSDENIESDDMHAMYACGANFIGLDMLGYGDTDRISGAIWSWNDNEPNDSGGNEDCAMQRSDGRFNDSNCANTLNFACENENGDWYITDTAGAWNEGFDACSDETNGQYTFSVPTNYLENQKLLTAKVNAGANSAWMFYSDLAEEGNWVANVEYVNLTANGVASQKSTGWSGDASRAIDGNTDGTYNNGSVTHTNSQSQDWWQVDLSSYAYINSVKLYNRTDCCTSRLQNFWVMISDTPFSGDDLDSALAQASWSDYYQGEMPSESAVMVQAHGRYLRIQQSTNNYLSLAEVQVMGTQGLGYSATLGGNGGGSFDDTNAYQTSGEQSIATVNIRAGSRIDAIGVSYANGDSVNHGGGGGNAYSLNLASGEFISQVEICASYTSNYNSDTVHYVKLDTNYGNSLSGGNSGSGTCSVVVSGVEVVGFYGGAGSELDRLGVIYK